MEYDYETVLDNSLAAVRINGWPRHRRRTTISQALRWMSDLPTDLPSRAAEFPKMLAGRHRAGLHELTPLDPDWWEVERRTTPHNVCWGSHCAGRLVACPHRFWNSPYHR